jgi:hypothetical protein
MIDRLFGKREISRESEGRRNGNVGSRPKKKKKKSIYLFFY